MFDSKFFIIQHPILMAVMTIAIAMIGYGIARGCRYYVKCQRDALLEAPINLGELVNIAFRDVGPYFRLKQTSI